MGRPDWLAPILSNTYPIASFAAEEASISTRNLARILTEDSMLVPDLDNAEYIYSIDATGIYNTWFSFAGAHGDLGSQDVVAVGDHTRRKVDWTIELVVRFTGLHRQVQGQD